MTMFKWLKKTILPEPDEFAKGIAETQLSALHRVKASEGEKLGGRELYIKVLSFRPTYGIEGATKIVEQAEEEINRDSFDNFLRRELNKEEGQRQLRFRDVVCALVEHEYLKFSGKTLELTPEDGLMLAIMRRVVGGIIPNDL